MKRQYRIVHDNYAGYKVQFRSWWLPIWRQCGFSNAHSSVERAEEYAKKHAQPVVKNLGRI